MSLGNSDLKTLPINKNYDSSGINNIGSLAGNNGLTDFSKLGMISSFKRPTSALPSEIYSQRNPAFSGTSLLQTNTQTNTYTNTSNNMNANMNNSKNNPNNPNNTNNPNKTKL